MAIELYCDQSINGALSTTGAITSGGVITASGGKSTFWNTSYDNMITAFSDSGSSTITLTLTQQDGGTLTTSFSNPQGTVTGVGAANRIAYWANSTMLQSNAGFTFDGTSFATPGDAAIGDELTVTTIANATSDTDKFLVADGTKVKYRTGAEVLSDIGAGTGTMSNWNLTADIGGTFSVGQGTTVDIAGGTNISTTRTGATVQINNGITNNNQLTNGAGYTTNTGTVTGTGTSGQLAIFSGSSSVTSNAGLAEISTGVLFVNSQVQVKGVNDADFTCSSDTDTGLGSFDGSNGVSLVSKGKKMITVKEGDIAFNEMTATAVSTTGPLSANQSNQAPTQDTLATLAVDPSGNVVRGEQEATFKFTLAQLNSTLGQTLISAPGADKAVVITYTDWMMEYSSTGSVNNQLEIRQANLAQANASVSVLPALRFNEIVNQSQSGSAPFYGFYTRDIPTGSGSQGRTYAVNKATTFHKQTSSPYPSGLTSISIKIRYRVFDVDTF